jgi:hypothetical protein
MRELASGHMVACHFPLATPAPAGAKAAEPLDADATAR